MSGPLDSPPKGGGPSCRYDSRAKCKGRDACVKASPEEIKAHPGSFILSPVFTGG